MFSSVRAFLAVTVVVTAILGSGCSDPKTYDVTKLTDEQKKELGQKLTADEGKLLAGWMVRKAFQGKDSVAGVSVSQALKEQQEWLAKQKEEEVKAAELRKKIEVERKARREEFAKIVSVTLVNKRNSVGEYDRRMAILDVAYENKSDKDIQGVKGVLKLTDIFGDKILNINWPFDGGVAAHKMFVERGMGIKINQFMDDHTKLWNADFDKIKSTFEIQTIIFNDGTKLDAPE